MNSDENARELNELELKLHAIWCDILEKESIPIDVSFFEAGGNSILLLKLVMQIINEMDSQITVPDVFSYPTIETMSEYLRTLKNK